MLLARPSVLTLFWLWFCHSQAPYRVCQAFQCKYLFSEVIWLCCRNSFQAERWQETSQLKNGKRDREKKKKSAWWLIKETLSLGVSDFAAVRKVAVYQGDQAGFGVTMMCSWVSWGMERSKVSSSPFYLYCRWVWSSNLWRQHPLGSAGSLWASMAGPGGPAGSLSLVSLVQTVLVLLGASAWYTRNTKAVWTAHFSAQAKPSISSAK